MKSVEQIVSEVGSAFSAIRYGGTLMHAPDDLTTEQQVEIIKAAVLSSGLHSIAASLDAVATQLERFVDEGVSVYMGELDE